MMQEFIVSATPGVARRLLALASITTISLDKGIEELAETGLIPPEWFDATFVEFKIDERTTVQKIVDTDLRAFILSKGGHSPIRCVLASALRTETRPIIVVTSRPAAWGLQAKSVGLRIGTDARDLSLDILVVEADKLISQAVIEPRRDGLLVIDTDDWGSVERWCNGPTREFAKTILVCRLEQMLAHQGGSWSVLCDQYVRDMLTALYPPKALSILDHTSLSASKLRSRGFTKVRPRDLYVLFNVIPDLL